MIRSRGGELKQFFVELIIFLNFGIFVRGSGRKLRLLAILVKLNFF